VLLFLLPGGFAGLLSACQLLSRASATSPRPGRACLAAIELLDQAGRQCGALVEAGIPPGPARRPHRLLETASATKRLEKLFELMQGEIEIIFQTIENLHAAVPEHSGDWYFTGKYPTPGGYRVVNQAYLNYFEKSEGRSY
jgi:amidophosphoribosyltransferase